MRRSSEEYNTIPGKAEEVFVHSNGLVEGINLGSDLLLMPGTFPEVMELAGPTHNMLLQCITLDRVVLLNHRMDQDLETKPGTQGMFFCPPTECCSSPTFCDITG